MEKSKLITIAIVLLIAACGPSNQMVVDNSSIKGNIKFSDYSAELIGVDSLADPIEPSQELLINNPTIIKQVKPIYPDIARRAGIEGDIVLRAWINKNGDVHKVSVMKADAEILIRSAFDAAFQYKFQPIEIDGKIVDRWVVFPIQFRLH